MAGVAGLGPRGLRRLRRLRPRPPIPPLITASLVDTGEHSGSRSPAMDPTTVANQPDARKSRPVRRPRGGPIVVAIALLGVGLLGAWRWWHGPRPAAMSPIQAATARGRSYLRARRPDLAFQAVQHVRDATPEAGEAMAVAGLALIEMGRYSVARMALERAVTLQPDQFEVAVTLGELNLDLGNARRGAEVLEMAARLRPREFGVWRILGRALDDLKDLAGAERAYRKALEVKPGDREMLIALIALLVRHGQSERARPWIDRALEQAPDDPGVLGLAAQCAFDTNRLDEALAFADRALARDPRALDALIARARCRIARSQWQAALADAERALVAATADDPAVLQLLGTIQARLGLKERARETLARRDRARDRGRLMAELTEQISLHPNDPEIRWRMGQIASESGSILLASRCFEASLALDPNYQPARTSLAALRAAHPELARHPPPSAHPDMTGRIPGPPSRPAR